MVSTYSLFWNNRFRIKSVIDCIYYIYATFSEINVPEKSKKNYGKIVLIKNSDIFFIRTGFLSKI